MFLIIIIVLNHQLCFFVKKKNVVSLSVTHSSSKGRKRAVPSVGCSTEVFQELRLGAEVPGSHTGSSSADVCTAGGLGWKGKFPLNEDQVLPYHQRPLQVRVRVRPWASAPIRIEIHSHMFTGLAGEFGNSLVAQLVKNLPTVWETQFRSLRQEDPVETGMAAHSSILAWRIPWTEEPGGL